MLWHGGPKNRKIGSSPCHSLLHMVFVVISALGLAPCSKAERIQHFRHIKEDLVLRVMRHLWQNCWIRGQRRGFGILLFELFLQTLRYFNDGYDPDIIKNIFKEKMLPVLGLKPNFTGCTLCGQLTGPFVFSVKEGAFLCQQCSHHDPHHLSVSQEAIKLLRLLS